MNSKEKCKCTMAISVLGSGCRYCQPQAYIDMLSERIEEDKAELDKATARIAQLENALQTISAMDYSRSAMNGCAYKAHMISNEALAESSDTWLSEHDKAVEVKVLEELSNNTMPFALEIMIDSRK